MSQRHLIVMAAGTGGHVMPGLAVAREMMARGWTVSWLGTTEGMENRLVPAAGITLDALAFTGLRGRGLLHTLTGGLRLLVAFWRSLMASLLGKPLMLVNADAALLMSNKALLPVADCVAFGFDGAAAQAARHGVVTGNPVRGEIEAMAEPARRFTGRRGPLRLLVVGGSLGAKVLNDCVPRALALLPDGQRPTVTHQTGEKHLAVVQATYAEQKVEAELLPFIDDMAQRLADCDVIVCRAGAVTVSELCAAGVAAVLVPLVISTTSHQRDNALWLAAQGGAIHLPQSELSPRKLADVLAGFTRDTLLAMATKARAAARPKAAARVADEIERLVAA